MPLLPSVLQCEFRGMVERIMERADLGDDVGVGWMRLAEGEHQALRSVVWIPRGGTPSNVQPFTIQWQGKSYDFLGTEALRVDCLIRGHAEGESIDGFEDTESMRRQILAAYWQLSRELRPSAGIGRHTWQTQNEGAESHSLNNRQLCIQEFEWHQPIVKDVQDTVTLAGAPEHNCVLLPDDATEADFLAALPA